jgi:cation diffusion facilitator CzcD-associated flavoprotein CzcO
MTRTPRAVVIGAGSAGLASAAELRRAGLAVTVLEAGPQVGNRWHQRYSSLRLNTLRALSGLPGLAIPRRHGDWVSGDAFATYLADYARHHTLDVRTETSATAIHATGSGWLVETSDRQLPADAVVLATGLADRPCWPDWHGFTGAMLHSADYREPAAFTGQRVLVVGSGNSATEIATDLVGHAADVWLSVRSAPLLVPTRQLGIATHRLSVIGAGLPDAWWDAASLTNHWLRYRNLAPVGLGLPEQGSHTRFRRDLVPPVAERGFAAAVRAGAILVVPATEDVGPAGVRLAGGRVLDPDVVIAATGYLPGYARLLGDLPVLDPAGLPLAWAGPLPDAPGLFVVGAPSLQGDIREHGREARRVRVAVQRLLAERPPVLTTSGKEHR